MGRGKVVLQRIENKISRQVTFAKRRNGLLKKAYELSILCDAEVALVLFSHAGRLYQFSSSSNMVKTLERYQRYIFASQDAVVPTRDEIQNNYLEYMELKARVEVLQHSQRNLLGEDLAPLNTSELDQLEGQVGKSLRQIRSRKTQVLMDELCDLKRKEQMLQDANLTLKRKVLQIVTDNGSNYKKACKTLVKEPEYNHIVWQPCAAYTVNLMLKDLAKFSHIDVIIKSAKRICRFFHNHNNLHDSMKKNVGGELIKPNATRFGTVFMFLDSYHEKKDPFRKWMVSDNWKESVYKNEADYVFAEELLSSNMWWSALEWVLQFLEPLYRSLRYADTQKRCTLSGFKKNIMSAVNEIRAHLGEGSEMCYRVMSKVSKRIEAMQNDTLMIAAAVLDPHTHYQINISKIPEYATALTDAIQKIADPDSAVLVFKEISTYRECRGRFGQRVARLSAENMPPTEWWFQFGGEVPNLQKYALRIVSQCVSSSGCERNWSAFALVQTRQRNRLLYGKLHKCVSVRHNLKIRAEEDQDPVRENAKEKEVDPSAMMLDTTMFDETNPMMEWLNEDEERVILDGAAAATAVFERIRSLNSSKKASHLGRKDNSRKRKRVVEEEDEYTDSDDEEDEYDDIDIDGQDDSASKSDGGEPSQVGDDGANQVENELHVTSEGTSVNRRSLRVRQAKKVKDLKSLYPEK